MRFSIWKFPLVAVKNEIEMPAGAELLHVGLDPDGESCVWVKVNPDALLETRRFVVTGTGHPLPSEPHKYIGTWRAERFIWHLVELLG